MITINNTVFVEPQEQSPGFLDQPSYGAISRPKDGIFIHGETPWWRSGVGIIFMAFLAIVFLQGAGCKGFLQNQPAYPASAPVPEASPLSIKENITEKWGIEIIGIRLTAGDQMLDFRYRVIDPEKASLLLQRQTQSYLIDQATGGKLAVPRTKLGPMRQTSVKPLPNRNYFILFANPGRSVKLGDKVTLVLGDLKIVDLVVE